MDETTITDETVETVETPIEEEEEEEHTCEHCGSTIDDSNEELGDGCQECHSSCERCGDIEPTDDMTTIITGTRRNYRSPHPSEYWCESCTSDHSFTCNDCREQFTDDMRNAGVSREIGEDVCDHCAESYYTCECCDSVYHCDSGLSCSCRECEECGQWTREPDADGHCEECSGGNLIKPWNYKKTGPFTCKGKAQSSAIPKFRYYGPELELESRTTDREFAEWFDDLGFTEWSDMKHDGSLESGQGVEIVAHPADYDTILSRFASFFAQNPNRKARSWDTGERCGIHVHVSKSSITPMALGRMLIFLNSVMTKGQFRTICGREPCWAAKQKKNKCIKDCRRCNDDRYEVLNITNKTAEFRCFRGTLNASSFRRYMQFVRSVIEWTTATSETSWKSFHNWVITRCRKDSPELWQCVKGMSASVADIQPLTTANEGDE